MYAHSPKHLSEWAELIDAELPEQYTERGYEDDGGREYEYEFECECDFEREQQRQREPERDRGS